MSDDGVVVVDCYQPRALRPRVGNGSKWKIENIFEGQVNCPNAHGNLIDVERGCAEIKCNLLACPHRKSSFCFYCKGKIGTRGCENCGVGLRRIKDVNRMIEKHAFATKMNWEQMKSQLTGPVGERLFDLIDTSSLPANICEEYRDNGGESLSRLRKRRKSVLHGKASCFQVPIAPIKLENGNQEPFTSKELGGLQQLYDEWMVGSDPKLSTFSVPAVKFLRQMHRGPLSTAKHAIVQEIICILQLAVAMERNPNDKSLLAWARVKQRAIASKCVQAGSFNDIKQCCCTLGLRKDGNADQLRDRVRKWLEPLEEQADVLVGEEETVVEILPESEDDGPTIVNLKTNENLKTVRNNGGPPASNAHLIARSGGVMFKRQDRSEQAQGQIMLNARSTEYYTE